MCEYTVTFESSVYASFCIIVIVATDIVCVIVFLLFVIITIVCGLYTHVYSLIIFFLMMV
jgi:hypothetical protein